MTALRILLDADGKMPELQGQSVAIGHIETVTTLEKATMGGRVTVGVFIRLPSGELVFGETTLRCFQGAAAAIRERYGDEP